MSSLDAENQRLAAGGRGVHAEGPVKADAERSDALAAVAPHDRESIGEIFFIVVDTSIYFERSTTIVCVLFK